MNPRALFGLAALLAMGLTGCQQRTAEEPARRSLERAEREITPADAVTAAREGNLQQIILFREAGLDLSQPDSSGETPLLAALRTGHMAVADNLLRSGVPAQTLPAAPSTPPSATTSVPPTPPADATVPGTPPVPNPYPNASAPTPHKNNQTALGWALAWRDMNILSLLLQGGADPNEPLATPASEDFLQTVNHEPFAYYLRKEKNVTPLMLAAATGQAEAVRALLAAGAKPGAQTTRHKTVAIWLASKHGHPGIVQILLGKSPRPEDQHTRLKIKLSEQKVLLFQNGELADSSPISSGRKGFATPTGTFVVTNKYRHWKSTLYDDAPMPYFMRLSCSDFGLHAGALPGYPASHGCIRLPEAKAAAFFAKVEVGTLVEIVD